MVNTGSTTNEFGFLSNNFFVSPDGTERMRIDSSGKVGIGTSDPQALLHVKDSLGSPQIRITNEGTGSGIASLMFHGGGTGNPTSIIQSGGANSGNRGIIFKHGNNGSETERMRIDSDGKVGIGVTDPGFELDVSGTIRATTSLQVGTSTNATALSIYSGSSAASGTFESNATGSYILFRDATSADVTPAAIGAVGDDCFIIAGGTEKVRIDENGNVGIGTNDPTEKLDVQGNITATGVVKTVNGLVASPSHTFSSDTDTGMFLAGLNTLSLTTGGSERLRINSNGLLGLGTTAPVTKLHIAHPKTQEEGEIFRIQNTNTLGTQDGRMITFYANTNFRGSLGYTDVQYGSGNFFAGAGCGLLATTQFSSHRVQPCNQIGDFKDNQVDLGSSTNRFDDVYATNGTIQTSDRNEKQDIEQLSDAESRVAVVAKGLLRKFRWIDAVEEKNDDARIHFGIIAQDLQDAFTAQGLDAGKYAMFISTTWWEHEGEEYIQDAPEGAVEKTRLGIRYPELLAFIIAAI
jgi:hypothetical protein